MSVKIEKQSNDIFDVTVSGETTTHHKVTITDVVHCELTNNLVTKESLLDFSFKFLLDREPNTSIMSLFEITVISGYFPEFGAKVIEWCEEKHLL